MKYLLIVTLLATASAAFCQENKKSFRFRSYNNIGMIEGQNGTSTRIESVNGVGYSTWFAGIGIGIDHYAYRSLPLYFDLKKEWSAKLPLFAYVSAGHNGVWVKKQQTQGDLWPWGNTNEQKFTPGKFYEGGIGYRLRITAKHNIVFAAGYSKKTLEQKVQQQVMCITWPCPTTYTTFQHRLATLVLKAGFRF